MTGFENRAYSPDNEHDEFEGFVHQRNRRWESSKYTVLEKRLIIISSILGLLTFSLIIACAVLDSKYKSAIAVIPVPTEQTTTTEHISTTTTKNKPGDITEATITNSTTVGTTTTIKQEQGSSTAVGSTTTIKQEQGSSTTVGTTTTIKQEQGSSTNTTTTSSTTPAKTSTAKHKK